MENIRKEAEPIADEIQFLLDQLYDVTSTKMKMPDGTEQEITPDGNIGLFTLGYKGIVAWRKKREEVYGKRIYSPFAEKMKKYKNSNDKQ